jgi:hypothetical protein
VIVGGGDREVVAGVDVADDRHAGVGLEDPLDPAGGERRAVGDVHMGRGGRGGALGPAPA